MTSERVRIGVVGAGAVGFHHARIASSLPGAVCAGIRDVDTRRAAEVSSQLGVDVFDTLERLLEVSDAIIVATPTSEHEDVASAALHRGIPTLIEKPLAPSLEAADRILDAAEEGGAFIATGHVERFNPAVVAAEPFLDAPAFVESHRMAPFSPRSSDVAVVLDLMIHDVDLVMALVGQEIDELAAAGIPVLTPNVDIANARLAFKGGAVANLTASRVSLERMRKMRIFQRSGYLRMDLAAGRGEFFRLRHPLAELAELAGNGLAPHDMTDIVERIPLQGDRTEPLARQMAHFLEAVRGEAVPIVSGAAGRAALAVSLAIQETIEDHVFDPHPT